MSVFRYAEQVFPGHPDKLADQIADAIVDVALSRDERAIVQVEVAVHRDTCTITGRCATKEVAQDRDFLEATVRAVYGRAGFGRPFELGDGLPADWQCPRGEDVRIEWHVDLEVADPDEQAEREYADDQSITIGHAEGGPESWWLPLEQYLSLRLRDALVTLCATDRTLGAGPDGKVLVLMVPADAEAARAARGHAVTGASSARGLWRVTQVVASIQHLATASQLTLERAVRSCVLSILDEAHRAMPWRLAAPDERVAIRFNESGSFVDGGPMNDNGQTGRKLVCDFYGPFVPIGGGALSGKDPWRVDRVGALSARRLAVALCETGFVPSATVGFVWAPRDRGPSAVQVVAGGGRCCRTRW
jgi:S-adenosylmethionine synthetase